MRYLLAICLLALPMAAAPRRLPGHITLVQPVVPPKKPAPYSNFPVVPKPTRIVATTTPCAHIKIVPTNPSTDARMVLRESAPAAQMPIYADRPACP
ncbi:MAG: hypothetical protein B7X34_09940 [Acidobacteriia bacterium 12-62-4]|nr:MAG: hypothetical protein B7X34_09940 [Acidobacteriia bacterium 12-62-4]